jgi:hypothetical protein
MLLLQCLSVQWFPLSTQVPESHHKPVLFLQLFAVLSAMQSASLWRMNKTWSHLNRRDRQVFDKLTEMFSEKDNFARLREHMDKTALKHQA